MKTTQHFVFLAILRVEKRWAEVKTSAIAYSPSVSTLFQTYDHTPFTDSAKLRSNHSTSKGIQ